MELIKIGIHEMKLDLLYYKLFLELFVYLNEMNAASILH